MISIKWSFLLITIFCIEVLCGHKRQYIKEPNVDIVNKFIQCINEGNTKYIYNVEKDGFLYITPIDDSQIDRHNKDTNLYKCAEKYSGDLLIIIGSNKEVTENHRESDKVTGQELIDMGIMGVGNIETNSLNVEVQEDASFFFIYVDNDEGCDSTDQQVSDEHICQSFASSYASVQVDNKATDAVLLVTIWPHHECKKGNFKNIFTQPDTISVCINRTTYSYTGQYQN